MNGDVKSDNNLQTHKDLWKTNKKEKDETITVKITDVSFYAILKSVVIFLLVTFIILPIILLFFTTILGVSLGSLL
jgi:hypothetical protein